ncbi:heparinase II/III family protein [Rhizobium sp. TRM95111]|uniref:heparinase II/III family protein n=1 Tax=Rhizobium alarense TaxID=2846851 RepID=UPI001F25FAE0|nr:heparinase II/III family protein [Rhizobium alarense]MCF3642387.1 heparinase II/III family protein [Rhizobium alarense]
MRFSGRRRLVYLYLREGWRRFSQRLAVGHLSAVRFAGSAPDRLIVAPTDLRSVDGFVADEIAAGRFPLAGRTLDCEGQSPFSVDLPSEEFAVRLQAFGWLRHLRAMEKNQASRLARMILDDWIATHGSVLSGIAWRPDVIAQRVIAWLCHSPVVLRDADYAFYRRFMRALAFQVRYLRRIADSTPDGEDRLRARIALAMATLAMPAPAGRIRRAARNLDLELDRQILPDGGHASRSPRAALELLLDLLPLRQTYVNLGHDVPQRLTPAIDRMFPALRFFRHQGGELALFNGAAYTPAHELVSVLRYDESGTALSRRLPSLGYERLAAGETVVLVDAGTALSVDLSTRASAGSLSMEMSSGRHRFIVNSGMPRFAGEAIRQLSRATAAHSVATLNDTSSSRISTSSFLGRILCGGVSRVDATRNERQDGSDGLTVRHDGYREAFGLFYERDLLLNARGNEIRGRERFLTPDGKLPAGGAGMGTAVVRFHVHPAIQLHQANEHEALLVAPDGESWSLTCLDVPVVDEEDVFFADPSGVRASRQLTLTMPVGELPEIQWLMMRRNGPAPAN